MTVENGDAEYLDRDAVCRNHLLDLRPRRRYRRRQGKGRTLRRLPWRRRHFADREHSLAGGAARSVHPVAAGVLPRRHPQERADAADRRTAQQRRHPQPRRLFCLVAAAEESEARRRSRSVEEGRAGRRRPPLRLMPYRFLCRDQSRRPRRRPARGVSGQGAARLQVRRARRRRHGGDGRCRLSAARGRDRSAGALSGAFVESSRASRRLRRGRRKRYFTPAPSHTP